MSLEICKKVHKKLQTNSLNKTSSLRRKIRKTSRRKRKRRRCGSDGCGCANIVNMNITTTTTTTTTGLLTTAIRKRTRTATMTMTKANAPISSSNNVRVKPTMETAASSSPASVLRSCKINVNSKRKQKLQLFCMHNYYNNNNNARNSKTANNIKYNNNKNNNNNNNNNNSNTSYTTSTSCSASSGSGRAKSWQQRIQGKQINLILKNIMISLTPRNTETQNSTCRTTARIPFIATAETIASARLPLEPASPFVAYKSSKIVQLYLKQSHQHRIYLHSRENGETPSIKPTQQTVASGDPITLCKSVKTITAGITRETHRTSQLCTVGEHKPLCSKNNTDASATNIYTPESSLSYCATCWSATKTTATATPTLTSSSTSSSSPLWDCWLPLSYAPNIRHCSTASSIRWMGNHSLRRCSTSSQTSDSAPRIQRKKLLQGLFMTLLVLSICNNNVLETSAASVRTSNSEMSLMLHKQMRLLTLPSAESYPPQSTNTTTTTTRTKTISGISVTKNNTSSVMVLTMEEEDQETPQNYHLQSSSVPSDPLAQTNHQQDLQDLTQTKKTSEGTNKQNQILLSPKQKRQQRVHQLPQYLTSTQETSFSQNGMTLEAAHNRSFQSLSIVDGRLTVPMDMDQQQIQQQHQQQQQQQQQYQQQHHQQQHHQQQQQQNENHSTSGSSTGSSGNSGFLVDGNEMVPFPKRHSMPVFDFGMPRNITARTGHMEAVIKCRVDRLDDKSVSWIRKRDLHILTVGKTTYTSDKRFQVTESKDSREWTLHVKSPQARDSGIYECQVNTEPKMSMAFQLNIIEISPDVKAVITGPADLYFKVGSAIILTCLVHQPSVKDIGPIHWYRGEYLITPFDINDETVKHDDFGTSAALTSKSNAFDHSDTDMYDSTVDDEEEQMSQILTNEITKDFTQRIAMEQQLCDTIKSRLRISNAQKSDSGNYTCQPTTASSASVMVHVINDENPAAMQKSGAATTSYSFTAAGAFLVYHIIYSCWSCWCGLVSPTLYLFYMSISSSSVSTSSSSSSSSMLSSVFVMLLALFSSCQYHEIYKTVLEGFDVIIEMLHHHLRYTLRRIGDLVSLSLVVWKAKMLALLAFKWLRRTLSRQLICQH